MEWYKHKPEAFNLGVAQLTLEETGAYILVLNLLYSRDGDLPDDDAYISKVLHIQSRTWRKVKSALMAKGKIWQTSDGLLMAKRVENTLKTWRKHAENQANNSKKRWESKARESLLRSKNLEVEKKEELVLDLEESKSKTRSVLKKSEDEVFARFKAAYPRREGANPWTPAHKAFMVAVRQGADPEAIIAGACRYAAAPSTKHGTIYVTQALTWLHQRRWEDDGPTLSPVPANLTPEQQEDWKGGWRPGMPSSRELRQRREQS